LSITTMSSGWSCRDQHLLDIGEERLAGHRTVEHHRRAKAIVPQRGDKGSRTPAGGLPDNSAAASDAGSGGR
jgi:hypothetical protein